MSNSRGTEWWSTRTMAAAGAMGLAKMSSRYEKTRLEGDAHGPSFVAFGDEREEDLGLLGTLGQADQVVQQQEVVVVELP